MAPPLFVWSAIQFFLTVKESDFVVDLYTTRAAASALPLKIGTVSAQEVQTSLFLVAPFDKKLRQAATVLHAEMGLQWPETHKFRRTGASYAFWFDHAHIALMGIQPPARILQYAAVTDVSDGWCVVDISGPNVRDVLARVTPLDMRVKSFKMGMTQRSMLMHMQACICCFGKSKFRLMVFRSMALTLVHDLAIAMESVAARVQKG